jgi:hypothetical protein
MRTKKVAGLAAFLAASSLLFQACSSGGGTGSSPTTPPPKPVINSINGGVSGSGTIGSLFILEGTNFGTPSATSSGYSVNFRDSATNAIVANAVVDLATSGNWTNLYIKATVPSGLTVSVSYNVTVTNPAGTSNAVSFLVVDSVSFSPSTILWSAMPALPVAQQGFPAVVGAVGANTFMYTIGGNTGTSGVLDAEKLNHAEVYQNQVNTADGTLVNATWTSLTPLPGKRGFAAAVLANRYNSMFAGHAIYVLGGLDDTGAATSTVYFAVLNADGSIPAAGLTGTWATTTALPQPLFALQAVVFHGRIYVAGGNAAGGAPVTKVYSARINSNGTLGTWSESTDLPGPLAYHQMVVIAGTLYVLGGSNAAVDPISKSLSAAAQATVYYNPINIVNGTLSLAWTINPNDLIKAVEKHSAVAAGSYVLVSGGLYAGAFGSTEQSYAMANTDGSLGSFNGATGVHTIRNSSGYDFYNHSRAVVVDASGLPHVYILGGNDTLTGMPRAEVWHQY